MLAINKYFLSFSVFISLLLTAFFFEACNSNPATVVSSVKAPLADLPSDLAADTFSVEGSPSAPYTMVELNQTGGFNGFVAVNGEGKPVWFFRTQGGASGFTRRQNGDFVFLDAKVGLVEVTVDGQIVHTLAQENPPGRHMHHDVTSTPQNAILFIADDWQMWRDSLTNGVALWEWDPENDSVIKRWSSFDHLDPDLDRGSRSVASDWLHANSVAFGPSGDVVLSLHFLDQIVSLSSDFQTIRWRLGGIRATIPVADPFSGQHCAREIAPGQILFLDNGYERTDDRYSRALELEVSGNTSQEVWQWRPPKDNWARIIGSAFRLPNGNTVVGFGTSPDPALGSTGPIEVYEVTQAGGIVWHMILSGGVTAMYRATPFFEF
ncbi:MAG TPA: aryl-sulfate sulfotransferase [Bacteroidota bacterium]|nr:aryl-sulfate sulfotransferase [Bacteroidota bacterium]